MLTIFESESVGIESGVGEDRRDHDSGWISRMRIRSEGGIAVGNDREGVVIFDRWPFGDK